MANTVEMHVVATDEAPDQTITEQMRFHLDFMVMMLMAGRTEEASRALANLREAINKVDDTYINKGENA
jgi:hypothetical protein